jgi:mRNA interferase RelE/StbE
MILRFSRHFLRNYFKAPKAVQDAFDKQSQLLLQDLHHPSLRAKKYDEARDLWQARVNYAWRFYFRIAGNVYLMDEIKYHPK